MVKSLPAMQETWVQILGQDNPLEKEMTTHSSILTWRIPMDRGAWQATVHGVAKSWVQLSEEAQHSTACRQPQAWLVGSCSLLSETFRPRLAKVPHYYTHITVRETALQYSSKLTLSCLHTWVLPPLLPKCNKCLCLVSSLPQMASISSQSDISLCPHG